MQMPAKSPVAALVLGLSTATFLVSLSTPGASQPRPPRPGQGERPTPSARPTESARPTDSARPTPSPRPTDAGRPKPPPPSAGRDIKLLEGALERRLTDTEKAAIIAAGKTRDAAIKAAITRFESEVAAIFDLTAAQLGAKIRTGKPGCRGNIADVLEEVLGRDLTGEEAAALAAAEARRITSIEAAHAAFVASAAAALNLSVAELNAKVRAFQEANRGGRR